MKPGDTVCDPHFPEYRAEVLEVRPTENVTPPSAVVRVRWFGLGPQWPEHEDWVAPQSLAPSPGQGEDRSEWGKDA